MQIYIECCSFGYIKENIRNYSESVCTMEKKLLVIIVTYNGYKWLDKCLNSIEASSVPADIFIVDNGSTDGTQDYIRNNWKSAVFVESEDNLGFGRANNLGLQYAVRNGYDYVYLLNQDAWVQADTFRTMIEVHRRNTDYGILSPMQIEANGQHLDRSFLSNTVLRTIGRSITDDLYFNNVRDVYEVKVAWAAHWLISIDCVKKVGGFSPTFKHYGEDDNYTDRAAYHGFKTGIVPGTKAVHDRENRILQPKLLAHLCYTMGLIELSSLSGKVRWIRVPLKYFQYTFKFGIFRHYPLMFKYVLNIRTILVNRRKSKEEGAFLEI